MSASVSARLKSRSVVENIREAQCANRFTCGVKFSLASTSLTSSPALHGIQPDNTSAPKAEPGDVVMAELDLQGRLRSGYFVRPCSQSFFPQRNSFSSLEVAFLNTS